MTQNHFDKWIELITDLDRVQCLASTGKIEYVNALNWVIRKIEQVERVMMSPVR